MWVIFDRLHIKEIKVTEILFLLYLAAVILTFIKVYKIAREKFGLVKATLLSMVCAVLWLLFWPVILWNVSGDDSGENEAKIKTESPPLSNFQEKFTVVEMLAEVRKMKSGEERFFPLEDEGMTNYGIMVLLATSMPFTVIANFEPDGTGIKVIRG